MSMQCQSKIYTCQLCARHEPMSNTAAIVRHAHEQHAEVLTAGRLGVSWEQIRHLDGQDYYETQWLLRLPDGRALADCVLRFARAEDDPMRIVGP